MTTISEVYTALTAQLAGIPRLRVKEHPPGDSEFPVAFPEPPVVATDNLADDTITLTLDLVVLVSSFEQRHMMKLLAYQDPVGERSILAKIKEDRSLGLGDVHVQAGTWRPLGLQELAYYRAWGAALTLTILVGDC